MGQRVMLLGSVTFAACLLAVTACGDSDQQSADRQIEVHASEAVPVASFDDWASYSDAVIVATAKSESELAVSDAEAASGEGMVPRMVSADVVEVLWRHPDGPAEPPDTIEFLSAGWIRGDGTQHEMAYEGAVRVEVGSTYLMPISYDPGDDEWAPLTPSSVVLLDDEASVAQVPDAAAQAEDTGPAVAMTSGDLAAAMDQATPDPVAEANRHLPARERYVAVLTAREAASGQG
jgi:hypothetical protein